jgi:3-methyl-2-oxobutanoate hydroxymethyltransferase
MPFSVAQIEIDAFKEYINDVRTGVFPADEHVYPIIEPEEEFE